jgi:type VI secretion system secreted protein VgrG
MASTTTQYTQSNRPISISSPLGEDVLLLQNLTYKEVLARPFEMILEMQSTDGEIDFNKILGQSVTVTITMPEGGVRYLNGIVRKFTQTVFHSTHGLFSYRAEVVPWISMLELTSNCQAYQNQTIPQIISKIFQSFNFSDYTLNLTKDYAVREFCVQYRESAFNFVHRLLEFAGIHYYFIHENGSHRIILCDSRSSYAQFPGFEKITYNPGQGVLVGTISDWSLEGGLATGTVVLNDYDYTVPRTNLTGTATSQQSYNQGSYEYFDYPGYYNSQDNPDERARLRLVQQQCRQTICEGGGPLLGISAGYKFTLAGLPRQDLNKDYLTVSSTLTISGPPYDAVAADSSADDAVCHTEFSVIPADVSYASPVSTPKPVVQGLETAVVVGPEGQTPYIPYTNKYACVTVQFRWDRYGQDNQNSSIPFRVSQIAARNGSGAVFLPLVGDEVLVGFIAGDPDQPVIIGSVYNGINQPVLDLTNSNNSAFSYIHDVGGNVICWNPNPDTPCIVLYSPFGQTKQTIGAGGS